MTFARRRTVVALALAAVTALGTSAGLRTAEAGVPTDPQPTLSVGGGSTTFGHGSVLPITVGATPDAANSQLWWCVVPQGATNCAANSKGTGPLADGSRPAPVAGGTVYTVASGPRPISASTPLGDNKVVVWHVYENTSGSTIGDSWAEYNAAVKASTTLKVNPEAPQITVSLSQKVLTKKDLSRKKVTAYAWAGATGVSESVMAGKMALFVDGKAVTGWSSLKPLPIPGSKTKKPAVQFTVPRSAIARVGTHKIQFRYQASGAAARAVGTKVYGSLTRTFRTQ